LEVLQARHDVGTQGFGRRTVKLGHTSQTWGFWIEQQKSQVRSLLHCPFEELPELPYCTKQAQTCYQHILPTTHELRKGLLSIKHGSVQKRRSACYSTEGFDAILNSSQIAKAFNGCIKSKYAQESKDYALCVKPPSLWDTNRS
jgi:hypothetical protein